MEVEDSPAPASGKKSKRARGETGTNGSGGTLLPTGNWETQVETIESIEESESNKAGVSALRVYIAFSNGHQVTLPMSTVRQRCPQRVCLSELC